MLKNLKLKSLYITTEDDIVNDFYIPCMLESVQFDRISGYFSSKALAAYAEGLEAFEKKNAKYRLIISKEISESDFQDIKKGYELKQHIISELLDSLDELLTLREEKNISNFAYLLAIGIIDIKFAFCAVGIFHDKSGVFYDEAGNIVTFYGSNNETSNGLKYNYEKFVTFASWVDSDFYKPNINENIIEFNKLWENKHDSIIVLPAEKVVYDKILTFNRGHIIYAEELLKRECIVADYDNQFYLQFNDYDINSFISLGFYKIALKNYVSEVCGNKVYFRNELSYLKIQKLLVKINNKFKNSDIEFVETNRLKNYLIQKDIHIEERRKIGINIKHFDESIIPQYEEYKKVVNKELERKLREKQMKDSFFMATMKKSANFSVPGSGKTSSALGVFGFYSSKDLLDKIVVVGPKNSFGSWKNEFKNTFGCKKELKYFDEHEFGSANNKKLLYELEYNSADKNLFLFNYEALAKFETFLTKFIDNKTLLIFDEVHKIKRINGEYASHALNISKNANFVIAMTGTPIPNSYCDIYNLLNILFPNEYDDYFGFSDSILSNPSEDNYEEINSAIYPFFCRTSKKELNVPLPNPDIFIENNVTDAEQQLYDIIFNKYRKNKLALFIRILQLESNPKMLLNSLSYNDFKDVLDLDDEKLEDAEFVDYSEDVKKLICNIKITSKKKQAVNTIANILSSGKKIILWCIFVDSINSFYNIFSDLGFKVAKIYGAIDSQEREKILDDFRNGEYDLLITNPHTLAESVSLHSVCHDAFYFEFSYNLVHLLQSKDRINRLGLPEKQYTQYYFSFNYFNSSKDSSKSLDKSIYNRLHEKEEIMLEAIDFNILEKVTTSEEDLDLIFNDMFKN